MSAQEYEALAALYDRDTGDTLFRSRVVIERHGFGRGEYKYFAYPLPDPIEALHESVYPRLAPVANRWNEIMGIETRYPREHAAFVERFIARGRRGRRRCYCVIGRAITTVCIRTCTANTCFRFRWPCYCPRPRAISAAASS